MPLENYVAQKGLDHFELSMEVFEELTKRATAEFGIRGLSSSVHKKHAIKKISTRVYYPGVHTLEIVVNGVSVAQSDFQLMML